MFFRALMLAGAIIGVFLLLLVRAKSKKSISDNFLIMWLGIAVLQLLFYYDSLSPDPTKFKYLQILGFSLTLLSSPLLYLYVLSLSFGNNSIGKKSWLHMLPYLIFNAIIFFFFLQNPNDTTVKNGILEFNSQVSSIVKDYIPYLLAIVPGTYTILSLNVLLKFQRSLPYNYSYTEKIDLNWLKWIVISLIILFISLFILIVFGRNWVAVTDRNLFAYVGGILAMYLIFTGYFGLRQTTIFIGVAIDHEAIAVNKLPKKAYKNSGLKEEDVNMIFQKLKMHMETEKPYLDENLNLLMLSSQLNITSNQLSQIINQKTESNFFNFVNSYRIGDVKRKLKNPCYEHLSILGIAYDCGFRSKASFNKTFKELVGTTPSEYQKF